MKTTTRTLFPTLFYEFVFSQDELVALCKEIENKKEEIKTIYATDAFESEVDDYWTDFRSPIKLLEYEKLIQKIPPQFVSHRPALRCEHEGNYWVAIYGERGYHKTHHHIENLYGVSRVNMSSVLYLSDIGGTMFWNPRSSSDELQASVYIPSEIGKMVMWPAHILHEAVPHGEKDIERTIVSSNWRLKRTDNGKTSNR